MWKPIVVATAALAIAGSSIVYAQQRNGGPDGYRNGGARVEHRHMSAEDRAAFADARIAALKAGLELTPDQAKNWPAFEQALRDMVQLRAQRRAARDREQQTQNQTPTAQFDRLARQADNMVKTSAVLKRIADTGAPLYMSLNDAQKERFTKLARMLRPHHHHRHARNEGQGQGQRRGWREGHGYGRDSERGGHRWREGSGYGRDSGTGGQWWGHHGRRSDGEQGGRMHRMLDTDDQGAKL